MSKSKQEEENIINKEKESFHNDKNDNLQPFSKNKVKHEINFEIIENKIKIYSTTSFQLVIPKKKVINQIEKQSELEILGEEDTLEENEFDYLSKNKPKGLRNLGGCCYMNSTLQCF